LLHYNLFHYLVGRLLGAYESLFYYDVENGLDFNYYNSSRSYTPLFDVQPTAEQQQEAERICTVNGELNKRCAYDYYVTGNAEASRVTATTNDEYGTAQDMLG